MAEEKGNYNKKGWSEKIETAFIDNNNNFIVYIKNYMEKIKTAFLDNNSNFIIISKTNVFRK